METNAIIGLSAMKLPDRKHDLPELRREAFENGFDALSDVDLLALVLGDSQVASTVLDHVAGLGDVTTDHLRRLPGVGDVNASKISALLVLAGRLQSRHTHPRTVIRRPSDVFDLVRRQFSGLRQEHLIVVLLDTQNHVVDVNTVYIGSLNSTVVRIAELFRSAIQHNSAGIIVVHNHPSGSAAPSPEDIALTHDLVEAGKLMDIAVLDHIIIGNEEWVSLRERGIGFHSVTTSLDATSAADEDANTDSSPI
ncbi:MAG: DNA repair protein RadC [Chloroflexi bacterium]|nr:DNA repair protein RadC [Chloroflexota bacterium]